MATCKHCGEKLSLFGACARCDDEKKQNEEKARQERIKGEEEKRQNERRAEEERKTKVSTVMLTTEVASNLNIKSRENILIAHADCAFDVKLQQKKEELLNDLKEQAYDTGANAVVGITFSVEESYSTGIGAANVKLFKLIAYGTAVVIE